MKTKTESTLNVIWTLLVRIVLAAALGWFIWSVRSVLITIILSVMLAYVLLPAVDFLCSKKITALGKRGQRLIATVLVFISFFFFVGIAVKVLITPFENEAVNFAKQINTYYEQADERLAQVSDWYNENVPEDLRNFLGKQDFKNVGSGIANLFGRVIESTKAWFKSILELLLIPVLAFYFVLQQVETHLLLPNVMRAQADIPPLLTVFALIAGGAIAGFLGALLAVPTLGAMRVLVLRVVAPSIRRWSGAEV